MSLFIALIVALHHDGDSLPGNFFLLTDIYRRGWRLRIAQEDCS